MDYLLNIMFIYDRFHHSWTTTKLVNTAIVRVRLLPRYGAFDLGLAVSVPLPIVTGIFVLLWFQSRLT